jgi:hypothetical protein
VVLVDAQALGALKASVQHDDEDRAFVFGDFDRLWAAMHIERNPRLSAEDSLNAVMRHLTATLNRQQDLRTSAAKLDWMLHLVRDGHLDQYTYMFFAASDIVGFLTSARSLLDHLSRALVAAAPKRDSLPKFSFRRLRERLDEHRELRPNLGERLSDLVLACDWFDEIKDLRDELIHYDALTLVFPTVDGVQFQLYKGVRILVDEPALMINENVASFERVAAAVYSQVGRLLEDVSLPMAETIGIELFPNDGASLHPGLEVLARWSDELLNTLVSRRSLEQGQL